MMAKYDSRGCIVTFAIVHLWMANTLIALPIPAEISDSQSLSNDDDTIERTATSTSISEPFPVILNEPSFSLKTAGLEPVAGSIQVSDVDPCDESLFSEDPGDNSTENVEKVYRSDDESSDIYDHFQVENSNLIPGMDSFETSHAEEVETVIGSTSHTTHLEAESISIPNGNVVGAGMPYPSLLYKTEDVQERVDHHRNDLDHEVSLVANIHEDFDDRSLLDVFGEVAKEYLTQQVIPPTDVDCRWDWRSFRCESSCICRFQWKRGDYHLGRACRRRVHDLEHCPPTVYVIDRPIPKRLVSLMQQTSDILGTKVHQLFDKVQSSIKNRSAMIQNRLCLDLWSYLYEAIDGSQCWLWIPTSTTILERIFCGRNMHLIPPCREDILSSSQQNRLPGTAYKNFDNRQFSRNNNNALTDLHENEIL